MMAISFRRARDRRLLATVHGSLLALLAAGTPTVHAWEKIVLEPSRDNTLYETPIDQEALLFELSNGAGSFLFSGRTSVDAGFRRRRALLQFDLAANLPAGAHIIGVELTLFQSRAAPGAPPADMGLHRVLQEWGEAGSDAIGPEGQGDFPEPGDATWHHRMHPDDLWDTAGGHFSADPSAVSVLGQEEEVDFTWPCTADLLADVQYWQQNPAENFGWIVVGGEDAGSSAHRFNSRENLEPAQRPRLTIYYVPAETVHESGFEDLVSCPG